MKCNECHAHIIPWNLGTNEDDLKGFSPEVQENLRAAWFRCPVCRYVWPVSWKKMTEEQRRDADLAEMSRRAVDQAYG